MLIFVVLFGIVVFLMVDQFGTVEFFSLYATVAFVIGSLTSMLCGFIGMRIAVSANYRTTYKAITSLEDAFQTAYQAGCVMGFSSVGLALGILLILLVSYTYLFEAVADVKSERSYMVLMELVAGYGLGGSTMALFGRVGGGIFTKAADVGADLVGKVENDLPEDSPRNPATIADNVGDNVGDIAGMGSDLFGSFAEATCAALVIMSSTQNLMESKEGVIYFPLLITAVGIFACFLTSIFGIYILKVDDVKKIANALNYQLYISTVLTLVGLYFTTYVLPVEW